MHNLNEFHFFSQLPTFSHSIQQVASSNAAIVTVTGSGLILLYTKFKVKTLKKPITHENIKHITIRGGHFDSSTSASEKGKIEIVIQ